MRDVAAGAHAAARPYGHIAEVLSDAARPIDEGAARMSGPPGLPGGRPASYAKEALKHAAKARITTRTCAVGAISQGAPFCKHPGPIQRIRHF